MPGTGVGSSLDGKEGLAGEGVVGGVRKGKKSWTVLRFFVAGNAMMSDSIATLGYVCRE